MAPASDFNLASVLSMEKKNHNIFQEADTLESLLFWKIKLSQSNI